MKKVLIITYYWPPAGGPGVQRVLKFAKYLPDFGWQPIILTVENGEYPAIDESLLKEIPEGIKVYKTKSFEPFNLYKGLSGQKGNLPTHILSKNENEGFVQKLSKWLRANVFIPDARVGWIPSIVNEGKKIIDIEKPDIIFSSSPPHSLQIGAMKLAKRSGLKWVADFRDPWTDGFWQRELPRTNYAQNKDLKKELEVLKNSDSIISVSKSIINLLKQKNESKYHVLPNGYDENDFMNINRSKSDFFTVVYTGSLRKSQIPGNFFSTISKLNSDNKIEKLRIKFIGTLHPDAISMFKKYSIQNKIEIINYMPHKKLLRHIVNADLLLLTIPNTPNNEGILTGKLFEYIGSKNFILCFGPKDGDAAAIIDSLKCGTTLDFLEDPTEVILQKYGEWQKNILSPVDSDSQEFTRFNLTKKLSELLDSLI